MTSRKFPVVKNQVKNSILRVLRTGHVPHTDPSVQVMVKEGGEGGYYSYIRFYSARAASRARAAARRGDVPLPGCAPFRVTVGPPGGPAGVPLARFKCEELANFYLGFKCVP